ncbi:MAG: glycosyltransferase [Helicobacter sp.]|nr:glycosyltransferase [Helicobacter sp.]MDY5740418.1 glycosyltransferase [Helicobacter sp.]
MENLNKNPKLFVVVPCYNEEEVLVQSFEILHKKLSCMIERQVIAKDSALVFVDDGSRDKTWEILKNLTHSCPPPPIFEAKNNCAQTF